MELVGWLQKYKDWAHVAVCGHVFSSGRSFSSQTYWAVSSHNRWSC